MPNDLPTVLVIGGGLEAVPVIRAVRRLPARVVVADGRCDAPAFRAADAGLLAATLDPESTIEAARAYAARRPIDAVLATSRPLALTAAAVAATLDLPGLSTDAAVLLGDRVAATARLAACGVRVARTRAVEGSIPLAQLAAAHPAAMVVKPVDSWGARGVVRVDPGDDFAWAFRVAATQSRSGRVLVQDLVAGRPLSVLLLVHGTRPVVLDVSERAQEAHARFSPFLIDGGQQVACAWPRDGNDLESLARTVVRALGVADTVLTLELREGSDGPIVVDVSAGYACGRRLVDEIPLAAGIDPLRALVSVALGTGLAPSDLTPRWHRWVAERACFPDPGTVVEVEGIHAVRGLDGVEIVDVPVRPGGRIVARTSNACRGGTIVATGPSAAVAAERAAHAAAAVRIVTRAGTFGARSH